MAKSTPKRLGALPGSVALFDTYSVVFRAFHALPEMLTSAGEPTSALYGACALVLKILREQRPSAFAFALDAPKRTFRHERFPEYKAQREAVPNPLRDQLRRLPSLLASFGAPRWSAEGFEADDVLATLTARLRRQGKPVLIVSGDRDLLQLVDDEVRVWFVGARGRDATLFDRAGVQERFGVEPQRLPTWTALVGDTADNIEGIPSVGPRTATRLVERYGTASEILQALEEITPPRVRENLRAHAERFSMGEELTRLRGDVPLPEGTPLALPLDAAAGDQVREVFRELEFQSLLPRLEVLLRDGVERNARGALLENG
jgi:DNA polymerase-1